MNGGCYATIPRGGRIVSGGVVSGRGGGGRGGGGRGGGGVVVVVVGVVVVHIVVQPMQHIVFVTPMTVYKNVPSSPNMGPPAVALSARNKKQNNNSNETQNRFGVHDCDIP